MPAVAVSKLAACKEGRSFLATEADVGQILVELALIDDRADLCVRLKGMVNLEWLQRSATASTKRS